MLYSICCTLTNASAAPYVMQCNNMKYSVISHRDSEPSVHYWRSCPASGDVRRLRNCTMVKWSTVQCRALGSVHSAVCRDEYSAVSQQTRGEWCIYAITITAQLRIRKSHNQQPAWSLWPWRSGGNVIDPWKNTRTQPNPASLGFHCRQVCANNQRSIDCYQEMPCVKAHRWPWTIPYWFSLPNSGLVSHKSATVQIRYIAIQNNFILVWYNECRQLI